MLVREPTWCVTQTRSADVGYRLTLEKAAGKDSCRRSSNPVPGLWPVAGVPPVHQLDK